MAGFVAPRRVERLYGCASAVIVCPLGYGGVARHAEHWSGYPIVTEAKKWGMVFFATIVVIHYSAFIRGDRLEHVTLECDESAAEAVLTLSYVIGMSTLLLTSY